MSSRALRKLQGKDDALLEQLGEMEEEDVPIPATKSKKKKNKGPANLFDLLQDEDKQDLSAEEQEPSDEPSPKKEESVPATKPKKKKKKKKPKKEEEEVINGKDEDDFDAALKEAHESLGITESDIAAAAAAGDSSDATAMSSGMKSLLSVEHRCLNPDNEMKKTFGSSAVQKENRYMPFF